MRERLNPYSVVYRVVISLPIARFISYIRGIDVARNLAIFSACQRAAVTIIDI